MAIKHGHAFVKLKLLKAMIAVTKFTDDSKDSRVGIFYAKYHGAAIRKTVHVHNVERSFYDMVSNVQVADVFYFIRNGMAKQERQSDRYDGD